MPLLNCRIRTIPVLNSVMTYMLSAYYSQNVNLRSECPNISKEPMIDRIISRMTARSPENRYQTIGEVVAALELIVPDTW